MWKTPTIIGKRGWMRSRVTHFALPVDGGKASVDAPWDVTFSCRWQPWQPEIRHPPVEGLVGYPIIHRVLGYIHLKGGWDTLGISGGHQR